jgi:hypothetical protein
MCRNNVKTVVEIMGASHWQASAATHIFSNVPIQTTRLALLISINPALSPAKGDVRQLSCVDFERYLPQKTEKMEVHVRATCVCNKTWKRQIFQQYLAVLLFAPWQS